MSVYVSIKSEIFGPVHRICDPVSNVRELCEIRHVTFAAGGDPAAAVVAQQVQRVNAAATNRINLNTLAFFLYYSRSVKC